MRPHSPTSTLAAWGWVLSALLSCAPPRPPPPPAPSPPPEPVEALPPRCVTVPDSPRVTVLSDVGRLEGTPTWDAVEGVALPSGRHVVALARAGDDRPAHVFEGAHFATKGDVGVVSRQESGAVFIPRQPAGPGAVLLVGEAARSLPFTVEDVAFSPKGDAVAAIDVRGVLRVVNVATGEVRAARQLQERAGRVRWGKVIAVGVSEFSHGSFDPSSLAPIVELQPGVLSPSGELLVALPIEPPALTVKSFVTGKTILTRTLKEAANAYEVKIRGGDRWVQYSERSGIALMDTVTKRVTTVPWLRLGEGDAESRSSSAPTADGRFFCQSMDSSDASYDLRARTQLHDRPGFGVRCGVEGDVAHVVRVPLRANEAILELPANGFGNWPDFVLSPDGSKAALFTTDPSLDGYQKHELTLLLVDIARARVLHRHVVGTVAEGGWTPTLKSEDERGAVATFFADLVDGPGSREVAVDWESGVASAAVKPTSENETVAQPVASSPARPPLLARRPRIRLAGHTMLVVGDVTEMVALAGAQAGTRRLLEADGCRLALSPKGGAAATHCEQSGKLTVTFLDGRKTGPRAAEWGRVTALAVADDGTIAHGSSGAIRVVATDGTVNELVGSEHDGGAYGSLSFSPDGKRLASYHLGKRRLVVWDRQRGERLWSKSLDIYSPPQLRFSDDSTTLAVDSGSRLGAEWAYAADDGKAVDEDALTVWGNHHRVELRSLLHFGSARPIESLELNTRHGRIAGGTVIGDRLVLATRGVALVYALDDGRAIATLAPLHDGGLLALFEDGRVDGLGLDGLGVDGLGLDGLGTPVAHPELLCLDGTSVVEPSACDAARDPGALIRLLDPDAKACRAVESQ
jgi:hypothetical protein